MRFESNFKIILGFVSGASFIALSFPPLASAATNAPDQTSTAAAPKPNAKKKPATTKTLHAKDLRSSFHPATSPGRTVVPIANDGDFSPSTSPRGFSVKMKSKLKTTHSNLAAHLPARHVATVVANGVANGVRSTNDSVNTFMRTIRVGRSSPVPQLAAGQALAVGDSYIVTSADFVSDAWTNSGDVHFFVPDSTQALALVGFNLGSNLAIFSTGLGSHLEHSLPLQRLRVEGATGGALGGEDFSVLSSGSLIAGAHRLRPVSDLTFVRERFELPVGAAMSAMSAGVSGAQFLFDRAGRWIGSVSPLDQRDGRKFDVTASNQAYEVIRQIEQRPPQALPMGVLQQQAASWQERWTNTFFDSVKHGLALRNLDCEAGALHVDDPKLVAELVRTRLVHCSNTMPVSLTRDYAIGIELVTGDVAYKSDVKNYLALDSSSTTAFSVNSFGVSSGASLRRGPASVNVMTGPECERSEVMNSHNHQLQVRFCTSALKNLTGLNDTTVTVISSDTGQTSTVHSMRLRGFEPKNAKRFMQWMIETETIQ